MAFTPYSESKDSLHKKVNLSEKNIIKILDGLEFIGAISKNKYGYYKVNFPCFYEDDVKKINNIVTKDVILLVNKIKKNCIIFYVMVFLIIMLLITYQNMDYLPMIK